MAPKQARKKAETACLLSISQRESRSKSILKSFSSAFTSAIGKLTTISCRKSYQAVQVTVKCKVRYAKMANLKTKSARAMSIALTRRLSRYPTHLRLSITYNNRSENAEHLRTNKILGTCSYFCEPFHSYERGTVENTNSLVRRFLPKKTNLAMISQVHLSKIQNWLNHRPRKCLGFKTPAEVFKAECCT